MKWIEVLNLNFKNNLRIVYSNYISITIGGDTYRVVRFGLGVDNFLLQKRNPSIPDIYMGIKTGNLKQMIKTLKYKDKNYKKKSKVHL